MQNQLLKAKISYLYFNMLMLFFLNIFIIINLYLSLNWSLAILLWRSLFGAPPIYKGSVSCQTCITSRLRFLILLFLLAVYLPPISDTESIGVPRSIWQAINICRSSWIAAHIFPLCQISLKKLWPKINLSFNTNFLRLFFVCSSNFIVLFINYSLPALAFL